MDFGLQSERGWRRELERELPWMHVLARRLVHGEEEASDLVQETWLAALTRPPGDRGQPRAWLRTVMSNLARQRGRRAWVRRRVTLDEPELSDPTPFPGYEQEQGELERLLLSELATLEEPFLTTLREHYLGGLQLVQIARRDGVPEGTVRWRLKAGIERLRARLDARYGDRRHWLAALLPFAGPRPLARVEPEAGALSLPSVAAGGALVALLAGAAWIFAPDQGVDGTTTIVRAFDVLPSASPTARATSTTVDGGPGEPSELVPAGAPFAPGEFPLDVTVRDAAGAPVAGAEVLVFAAAGFEPRATTAADGRATITARTAESGLLGVPCAHDRLVLRARAAGHATSAALFLRVGEATAVELALAGKERVLRGRVSDAAGQPLAGVGIHAVLDPGLTSAAEEGAEFRGPLALGTTSAADGSYELTGLEYRALAVVVTRAGSEPSLVLVNADKEELPLVFVPGGTVRGRIQDERGEPVAGARVWVEPLHRGTDWCAGIPGFRSDLRGFALETRTDSEGWYELADVHPRPRRIRAASVDAPLATAGATISVLSGQTSEWSTRLAREPGHRLRLVDEEGVELGGWVVVLLSNRSEGLSYSRQLVADAHGRVECHEGAGACEVLAYGPSGMGEPRFTGQLTPSEEEVTLVVPTESSAHLVGRVPSELLAADPEARVIAYHRGSRQPFTLELERASGRFRAALDAGDYALLLCGRQGGAWLADVTLARGERRRLGKLTLPEPGQVLLRADRTSARTTNYRLELCFGQNSMRWREGALPLFEELDLLAGLYRLDAVGQGGVIESAWVDVPPRGAAELDLARLARLEIRVSSGSDPKHEKLSLTVFPAQAGETSGDSARRVVLARRPDGEYRQALRLPEGAWIVRLLGGDGVVTQASVVMPSSGERELRF